MLLTNILLLGIGLWAVWTGFKLYKQEVYGIALLLTGLIVVLWGWLVAPLWLQICVESLLIGLIHFFSNFYAKESLLKRRNRTKTFKNYSAMKSEV